MVTKLNVAILDDHQPSIDGYRYRLENVPDISIAAVARTGEELEISLAENRIDILLLDLDVPTSACNSNPYPILYVLPQLLRQYPELNVLIISMHCQRTLIRIAMDAGAKGFIVKDDYQVLEDLESVVRSVSRGGVHLSQQAHQLFLSGANSKPALTTRQLEALSLCAAYPDVPMTELAKMLNIAHSTYRNLMRRVYSQLGVKTRASAVAKARLLGLITPEEEFGFHDDG